jgi:hypothetical protein
MAIDLPPKPSAQLSDSEAEALFEEAREIERSRRRRKLAGASVVAGIAVAAGIGFGGGGGGASLARPGAGAAGLASNNAPQQQTITTIIVKGTISGCTLASQPATPGDPPPGQCITEVPNGQQYQCPIAVLNSLGDAATAATNSACHRARPPAIPISWRPTLRRMHAVTACLQHAGLTASGSAIPPSALRAYPDTPIASVMIAGAEISPARAQLTARPASSRPTVVSFYRTTTQAREAYNRTLLTVTGQDQGMAVRGRVLYTWNSHAAKAAGTERSCLLAA